MTWKV